MLFYSTNRISPAVHFREATLQGQPADKGLFFPTEIPALKKGFVDNIRSSSTEELAFQVIKPYTKDSIPEKKLLEIISSAFDFPFPLKKVNSNIYSLELFHGPTLAFKDVGARFLSRCLNYFNESDNKKIIVLVATSGDTGGAVANGFADVDDIHTIILYPKGKVSEVQELQLTTCGTNVTALQVNGTFDDCQALVKTAFNDQQLGKDAKLTSANSINVARWLPQQVYYLDAIRQWNESELPVIAVPSGNFGNIAAGMVAIKSVGLPIKLVAAMNANDSVHNYILTGNYKPQPTIPTISNAMDVGDPSNFVRILSLFGNDHQFLKSNISTYSIQDELTRDTIERVYKENGYLLDPHGAVAFAALQTHLSAHGGKGIFLETAHPVKFSELIEKLIDVRIEIPERIKFIYGKMKNFIPVNVDYKILKQIIRDLSGS